MNGKVLAEFAKDNNAEIFCNSCNLARSTFAQDGDLSQNSKTVSFKLEKLAVVQRSIFPCIPDLNPVGSNLNLVLWEEIIQLKKIQKQLHSLYSKC